LGFFSLILYVILLNKEFAVQNSGGFSSEADQPAEAPEAPYEPPNNLSQTLEAASIAKTFRLFQMEITDEDPVNPVIHGALISK
jgi:hypothetical protein